MQQTCLSYGQPMDRQAASFDVALTATDNEGNEDTAVKEIALQTMADCPANIPPQASGLLVSQGDYCTTPSHYFSWTYSDAEQDTESAFQFQLDNNSDFSSPEVDRTFAGLSYPSTTINSQSVLVSPSQQPDKISYNQTYYWRVRVWDSRGDDSGWLSGPSFSTEKHLYPLADFKWSPQSPAINEIVKFEDTSQTFGGSWLTSRLWSFEDGSPAFSSLQKPQVLFGSGGGKTVGLNVIDSDNYSCSIEKEVSVGYALPQWREVEP